MNDNGRELKQEEQKQPEELIQMVITFQPATGRVSVTGPINNRTLSYGMLEMAKEAIYDLKEKMKSPIQIPKQHGIIDFIRNKK